MSSSCTLELAGYPIDQSRSYPIPELMVFFRERDRRVFVRKICDRNPIVWGISEDDSDEEAITYSVRICDFKARMDLLGFTLEKTKIDFEESKMTQLEFMNDTDDRLSEPLYDSDIDTLERATFDDFVVGFQTLRERRLSGTSIDSIIQVDDSPLIKRLFRHNHENFDFYPCEDLRFLIRAFAESCPEHAIATYELTEIVHAGYYEPGDPIADMATHALIGEYPRHGKIIILTEGKTDQRILEGSLRLLYPYLADYFSFMDFETLRAEGGAGVLVNTIKSFIGAGIMNRTIALFDNDTAAVEALRGLASIDVPENIKLMRLPDIDLARNYPTLGPNGISRSDINGLACAIELYLGHDVLELNSDLVPIQWTGYSRSEKKYQGILMNKEIVHSRFFDKLEACKHELNRLEEFDWTNLRTIFEQIFSAFH